MQIARRVPANRLAGGRVISERPRGGGGGGGAGVGTLASLASRGGSSSAVRFQGSLGQRRRQLSTAARERASASSAWRGEPWGGLARRRRGQGSGSSSRAKGPPARRCWAAPCFGLSGRESTAPWLAPSRRRRRRAPLPFRPGLTCTNWGVLETIPQLVQSGDGGRKAGKEGSDHTVPPVLWQMHPLHTQEGAGLQTFLPCSHIAEETHWSGTSSSVAHTPLPCRRRRRRRQQQRAAPGFLRPGMLCTMLCAHSEKGL